MTAGGRVACTGLLWLACGIAPVLAAPQDRDTASTYGWLRVEGAMQESACHLEMASRWQQVELAPVGSDKLLRPGDSAEPTPFYLRLEGCIRSAGVALNSQNNTMAWSSQQPLATLVFAGVADDQAPELFRVNGAQGVGLRLRDAAGHTLRPGVASQPLFLSPGGNALAFTVAPERTAAELQAGEYGATLDFQIHYQ
ncbi:fimbrial protein [Serratia grimesii]|nr:fimbrial protein [Serratia grimesii]